LGYFGSLCNYFFHGDLAREWLPSGDVPITRERPQLSPLVRRLAVFVKQNIVNLRALNELDLLAGLVHECVEAGSRYSDMRRRKLIEELSLIDESDLIRDVADCVRNM